MSGPCAAVLWLELSQLRDRSIQLRFRNWQMRQLGTTKPMPFHMVHSHPKINDDHALHRPSIHEGTLARIESIKITRDIIRVKLYNLHVSKQQSCEIK